MDEWFRRSGDWEPRRDERVAELVASALMTSLGAIALVMGVVVALSAVDWSSPRIGGFPEAGGANPGLVALGLALGGVGLGSLIAGALWLRDVDRARRGLPGRRPRVSVGFRVSPEAGGLVLRGSF